MNDDFFINELLDNKKSNRDYHLLAAGISCLLARGGKKVSTYHALLEDEWKGRPSALQSLQNGTLILENLLSCNRLLMRKASQNFSSEMLTLAPVLEGVVGTVSKHRENEIKVQNSSSALVTGDAFMLQNLFLEMAHYMLSITNEQLLISNAQVTIEKNTNSLLRSDVTPGEFAIIRIVAGEDSQISINDFTSITEGHFLEKLEDQQENFIRWIGVAFLHKGEMLIHKEGPGKGLAFILPITQAVSNDTLQARTIHGRKETILLVDDEDMIWDVVFSKLVELGYTVLLAENGADAVETYRSNPNEIDLILMDMVMPVLNGRDAFHQLKAINPRVKVLLASGYVDETDVQDVLSAGAMGFMRKPYRLVDLSQKVRDILDKETTP